MRPLDYECTCSACDNIAIETGVSTGEAVLRAIIVTTSLVLLAVLFFGCSNKAYADYSDTRIVDAIGKAENSKKFPYGIKSERCSTVAECRQICLNSVRNARRRWAKAGKPEDFITFMGRRYSPPETNPNWVKLVKHFLNRKES